MQLLMETRTSRVLAVGPTTFTPAEGQEVIPLAVPEVDALTAATAALDTAQAAYQAAGERYDAVRGAIMTAFAHVDGVAATTGGTVVWDRAAGQFAVEQAATPPVPVDDETLLLERAQSDPVLAALLRRLAKHG